jgi:uncharacterized protein YabN with tetrapyrrole methylase and pyrophosphatase domain
VRAIRRLHGNVVDLFNDYWTGELCDNVYGRLQEVVLAEAESNGPTVAIVVDGHPMFFDDVNWGIVREGRRRGLRVEPLPAVSCLDTMTIDLGIDLGDGTQIIHANQLVAYDIRLDPHVQTFVFQVGKFGTSFFSAETTANRRGRFTPLARHLTRFYPRDHFATLIVSKGAESIRKRVRLGRLDEARAFLHRHQDDGLTMYIPPVETEPVNRRFMRECEDERHLAAIAVLPRR